MCFNKTHLKIAKIFKNTLSFIYCNKIGNFVGFQVINLKKFFLFEEAGNFRVFDFSLYTEIESSEIFSRLSSSSSYLHLKLVEVHSIIPKTHKLINSN